MALRPDGISSEDQYVEVDVEATALLQSSSEHIAISVFANQQPFTTTGAFGTNAPNGGIGIVLGRIDNSYHPSCPVDLSDTKVEFAIEQFAWSNPSGSRILNCVSINKSALIGVGKLKINILVTCAGTTCNATANLQNATTLALLGFVADSGVPLKNPTIQRRPWYAVTNFADEPVNYSASFWVRAEMYTPHF